MKGFYFSTAGLVWVMMIVVGVAGYSVIWG